MAVFNVCKLTRLWVELIPVVMCAVVFIRIFHLILLSIFFFFLGKDCCVDELGSCKTGSSQRKHAAMLDSDDDNSSVSSSSTARSDHMSVSANEEVQLDKDTLLDQALDALYEKR